ncbi:DHA2 family efflux MFS transporter permease subunit [Rhodococcus artemisiae]|uniref:DHA2 family efflux MFS transporter permease subunit n=1 Tax=Rhodococcus artemisiae TaxID=714159 RepID=A0ABU7LIW0_9NOCA|nr:DHA2 family efflux MFS transporter permease subunit [Rhodococcus artemisiae]MEE2061489.1 DHA2 family efflux MFS transporter permease subunit [Rhodococcus artemisiae]
MTAVIGRAGQRAAVRPMTVTLVVVLNMLMVVLDTTIVHIAIGTLAREFHATMTDIQWVTTGYVLGLVTIIPITAWAVGRFGTKRLYLTAIILFVLGSVLCACAWDVWSLVVFRVVQGLGGGMLMPVGMTIVLRAAGEGENGRLMSMLGIPPLIGPLIGPVLGGLLIDAASWRWIFLINVPVGLVGVLLAARLLPTDPNRTRRSLDWIGLALLSCGLAVLVFGLTGGGIMFAALGGLLGAGFVVRSLTTDEPLIELRLFRRRRLAASALTLTFAAAAYFGSMVLLPLYYQMVRGEDAHTTGLLSVPQVVATGLTMQVATRLVDRVPPGRVVALGTIIAPTGVLLFAVLVSADTPYWQLMAAMSVMGVGIGMTLMPATAAGTRGLTHDEVPSASTGLMIIQQVAVALGTAVFSAGLARSVTERLPEVQDLEQAFLLPESSLTLLADAFRSTYLWVAVILAAALLPALFLPRRRIEV